MIRKIWLFKSIVLVSAFLLFQIELIIAKILLAKYGGSFSVWGGCVVFFQTILLLGYMFAHLGISKVGVSRYLKIHLLLSFLPLLSFPATALHVGSPLYQIPQVIEIFWHLLGSIGLVFFFLSTVSVVLQSWLASSRLPEADDPYELFAVSNLGSFAAILSYPFVFEYLFDLPTQILIWRIGYLLLLILNVAAFSLIRIKNETAQPQEIPPVNKPTLIKWTLLGAAGVIMFLSVTAIFNIALVPIPLLWVIPLSLYLLSFVLNFKRNPWCPSWIRENVHVTIGFCIVLYFLTYKSTFPSLINVILYSFTLFIVCMFCQNELYRSKPDQRHLTYFYLIVSLGGVLGGMFVSWIAPVMSNSLIEYFVGFLAIAIAMAIGQKKARIDFYQIRLIVYMVIGLGLWGRAFPSYNLFGILLILFIIKLILDELKEEWWALIGAVTLIILLTPVLETICTQQFYIVKKRNYYGIWKVFDIAGIRHLNHGMATHGTENLGWRQKKNTTPSKGTREVLPKVHRGYYRQDKTPVAEVILSGDPNNTRTAVIGLGPGVLAVYNTQGREMDFFELDPDLVTIANENFTYLRNSKGKVNFFVGDGRLSLEKRPAKYYDLIIIDAFSGDAFPFNLMTTEAIDRYRTHLKDNGIILFHITNRYLDLSPVLETNARVQRAFFCGRIDRFSMWGRTYESDWMALTWNREKHAKLTGELGWSKQLVAGTQRPLRPWSDQYSSAFSALKIGSLTTDLKNFQFLRWKL